MKNEVLQLLKDNEDLEQSRKMSAYMKNKFIFAGIPRPKLKELIKPVFAKLEKDKIDWKFIFDLWNLDFREAQYVALEYLLKYKKKLLPEDIDNLENLIINKSWWETVDTIDALVGEVVLKDKSLKLKILEWSCCDNLWLRRTSIDFQQRFKENTDLEILEKVICANLNSDEFFINKSIGWSLREYSKIDSLWVKNFIERHKNEMSTLSIKEASKLF